MSTMTMERARDVLPGGCLGTFRLPDDASFMVRRAKGARLWTTDDRELIDLVLGSGPMVLGHAHPRVVEAVQRQAALGTTYYALNEPAVELAERIVELVPAAEAVKLVGDGAEATFYALRLARAFTGRSHVLKFEGAYHGHHDYSLHGLKPTGPPRYPTAQADSAGIPAAVTGGVLVAPYNDAEATRTLVSAVADDLAAIIVEPVQRSIEPRDGFLDELRALCDDIGALLVFDEVVTGFRMALGGAEERYGVRPDLCALGKIVGGGLPLAAVAGRREIVELADPTHPAAEQRVYLSGTLNGNPLAAVAGLATLEVLEEDDVPAQLERTGTRLADELVALAAERSIPLRFIGPPSFAEPLFGDGDVVDYRSYVASDRATATAFGRELLRRGIFVNPGNKLYMSSALGEAELTRVLEASAEALDAVRGSAGS